MTAVLVTGARGFLGSALVNELLESGYDVRALVRYPASSSYPKAVEIVVGDVRDPQCARQASIGCETIVHLAGKAHALDDDHASDQDYQSVNVDGTKHLLDGAVAGGVRKFIYASSVKVFGETTTGLVDEREPPLSRELRTSEGDDRMSSRRTRLLPLPKFDRPQLIKYRVTCAKQDDSRNPYNSE